MSQRRVKSLHFNLGEKNVVFHHEHRSKRGRNKIGRGSSEVFYKYKKKKEELKYDLD